MYGFGFGFGILLLVIVVEIVGGVIVKVDGCVIVWMFLVVYLFYLCVSGDLVVIGGCGV